jgi:cytochrome c oxidase cbb3-type subunit III
VNHRCVGIAAAILLTVLILFATACNFRPPVDSQAIPPGKILDFAVLYSENCAGCHGQDGKRGLAVSLGDPVYLAIADDTAIRATAAQGVAGTAMPAFAQSSGGSLTDAQIDTIVAGIRTWAKPGFLSGSPPPPYMAQTPGDPSRGANVYDTYCSSCHGAGGQGAAHASSTQASSILDESYLALVSDQALRTTVIVGRPELGAPDWRGDVAGKPLSSENISDVVAWLSAQRRRQRPPQPPPQNPGGVR